MRLAEFGRYALGAFVAAILAGCGGSQMPTGAPAAMPQTPAIATRADRGGSWMLPEGRGRDLLYVAQNVVNVYTYPRGNLLGSLGVGGLYLCTDTTGNVFIPGGFFSGQILVYAHGATEPKAILNDPYSAVDCSVDPSTEAVAVTEGFGNGIIIFPYDPKKGWRYAKLYTDPDMETISFCAYDKHGNLFVDGAGSGGSFMLAELPKNSKTFITINLDQSIGAAGSMQSDRKDLAIADLGVGTGITDSIIYRFAINGTSGVKVSTTTLDLSYAHAQFWIQDGKVIGPIAYDSVRAIGFWRFPAGGSPIRSFSDSIPSGEAVSLKQHAKV